jgi:hypothetical protein
MQRVVVLTALVTTLVLILGTALGVLVVYPALHPASEAAQLPILTAASDPAPAPSPPVLLGRGAADSDATDLQLQLDALRAEIAALRKSRGADLDRDLLARLAVAVPHIIAAQIREDEMAARATLRNACSAHAQFQQSAKADTDRDGTGEYGGFLEMSGAVPGRMTYPLVPPVLSGAFRTLTEHGEAQRKGYYYRFYLPDARGAGVGEPAEGFSDDGRLDPDLSETTWCCYAWPQIHGVTGTLTFFMNQAGNVLATDDERYTGSGQGPTPDAAFQQAGAITGAPAVGSVGADGNTWSQVN